MGTPTCHRILWVLFARLCTLIFPDFILKYIVGLRTAASRQAWREKIATLILFLTAVGVFLFWMEYISTLFCNHDDYVQYSDVYKNESKYVDINGNAFEFDKLNDSPTWESMASTLGQYSGYDVSPMFPWFMQLDRDGKTYKDPWLNRCIVDNRRVAQADAWLAHKLANDPGYTFTNQQGVKQMQCPWPNRTLSSGAPCYPWPDNTIPTKGEIVYDPLMVANFTTLPTSDDFGRAYVILDDNVLDVTAYLDTATNVIEMSSGIYSRAFALDRMFLPLDVTMMLFINLGTDITLDFYANITDANIYSHCLHNLFFKGVVLQNNATTGCRRINPALWATMGIGLIYFLLKMNLAHLCRLGFMQRFLFSSSFGQHLSAAAAAAKSYPFTILLVPCYAEPSEILRQTFESLARSNYDDERKLLLFVCDGSEAQSRYDSKPAHVCLLELLGYSGNTATTAEEQPYVSLGQHAKRTNCGKVYAGFYETGRNRVPYLVVVKTGAPGEERTETSGNVGNRGKRDSMVLIMSFLERCTNLASHRMAPLEYELFNQCYSVLGIDPRRFKYMLVVDADTQVHPDAVPRLVARLEADRRMLAISGHARPANPEQNIITMLQVFPLYQTFYSGLAYEAFLGTVLSVNGGLVMYKLWTEHMPGDDLQHVRQQQHRSWWHWWPKSSKSTLSSQQTIQHETKWPKVSDEIHPEQVPWDQALPTASLDQESRLSLSPNSGIRLCCIHPTVLRGFAAARADTLHMQNVLLLGEEQYLGVVLLKSHPQHRLGFEPEAVGYVTLPTHLWSLQALQSRNLRSALHIHLELQRVAWDLGFTCWILSVTKLVDMLFSVPIIIYSYSIFVRYLMDFGLAYAIIALCFCCLIALHIVYFIVRRQFKYVLWFIIYCLFSVPLFAVWFPIVALWCSDYANRWFDVWPTASRSRYKGRAHGIIDRHDRKEDESKDKDDDDDGATYEPKQDHEQVVVVPRMRLGEYEAIEAERAYQRAMEEAAALDSKFRGFTGFVEEGRSNSIRSLPSRRSLDPFSDPLPPSTATRFNRLSQANDGYNTASSSPTASVRAGSMANPFASVLDNPFNDEYAVKSSEQLGPEESIYNRKHHRHHHKQSQSQSSYFSHASSRANTPTGAEEFRHMYTPPPQPPRAAAIHLNGYTTVSSSSSSSRRFMDGHARAQSMDSVLASDQCSIRSTVSNSLSIATSNLSMDPELSLENSRYDHFDTPNVSNNKRSSMINEEGRSAALHGRVGLCIPGHIATAGLPPPAAATSSSNGPACLLPARIRAAARLRKPSTPLPLNHQHRHHHHRNVSDSSVSARTTLPSSSSLVRQSTITTDLRESIVQEIRLYLQDADLDSITRAQVKEHLYQLFGPAILDHEDQSLQDFIHRSIEDITLELLTRPSSLD
ncbi:hypothetical protein K492DRAFT_144812 [Lichtheimia hyalospora FSU 10163]|nr:hypothetical protein K492DRAFT_144812 [Lichtheimia hyalospora FSU 10163]